MKKKPIVCYVAGSSGGHIIPCLTLAHEEKQENPDTQILFFSTDRKLDTDIILKSPDISFHVALPLHSVSLSNPFNWIMLTVRLMISLGKLCYYLITQRPTKMICTGGLIAIPATICARILAIPVELYELNVEPGRAIQFLSSWSVIIKTCFTQTQHVLPKKKCIKVTYPVRFFDRRKQMCQKEALSELNLDAAHKTIIILGGSQGSLEINKLIHTFIIEHPELHKKIQIIHQIGHNDTFDWSAFYAQHAIPAHVFSFCLDLEPYYAAADLILCRAGAGTLFEALFFGKPCIAIPLIHKRNSHQLQNALAMQEEYSELFTTFAPLQREHAAQTLSQKIITRLGFSKPISASENV